MLKFKDLEEQLNKEYEIKDAMDKDVSGSCAQKWIFNSIKCRLNDLLRRYKYDRLQAFEYRQGILLRFTGERYAEPVEMKITVKRK